MRPSKTQIAKRVGRLEEKVGPDVCRCGVEDVPGARNITAVYGDDPGPTTTCPDCGRERIVTRLDEALHP